MAQLSEDIEPLRRELQETSLRLSEAEQTLAAIRDGAVDALVVGAKVYTLVGAQEPYRLVIEQMSEGAMTLSRDGVVLYANQAFARLLEAPLERLIGAHLRGFLEPAEQPVLDQLVERGWSGACSGEVAVRSAAGTFSHLRLGLTPLQLGEQALLCVVATDITERKRAEDTLRSSEERHRTILHTAMDGFWLADQDGRLLEVNDAYCRLSGYSAAELLSMRIADLKPEGGTSHRQTVLAQGQHRFESSHVRKDGGILHVEVCAQQLPLEGGLTVAFLRDITERKRVEEALRDSEERFRELFTGAPLGIALIDSLTGLFYEINPMYARISGRTIAELRETDWMQITHPDDVQEDLDNMALLNAHTTNGFQMEKRYLNRDGAVVWINMTIARTRVEDGASPRHLCMIEDITERKRAEEAVRWNQSLLQLMSESSPFGFLVVDNRNDAILHFNQRFCDLWGISHLADRMRRGELKNGDIIPDCLPVLADVEAFAASCAPLQDEANRVVVEDEIPFTGGRTMRRFSAQIRGPDDGYFGRFYIFQDITERKRAEERRAALEDQLHHAQKMDSVGRLAGGVAHDFNNMLGVILGHTEMALEQVGLASSLKEDLEEVRKAAVRSAALTRQLLAFARKQAVAPAVLDVNDRVEEILAMLRRLLGENIQLGWLPAAGVWPVYMDASQFDQILTNLCVNARDAISTVGTLTVETANFTLDAEYSASHLGAVPGDYMRLTVRDDGCGIDEETRSHMFEPFFTTKLVGEGTGLGLATVHGIVMQNKGVIDVESEPGHGTRFTIFLPRHDGIAGPAVERRAEATAPGHETILIVEDEPAILNVTRRMLERMGYAVLTAGTPAEAVRQAEQHGREIHLLLSDVVMPEMSGPDLARNLMSRHPHLKLVFMSGFPANVNAQRGLLENSNFLQKPFSKADLAAKIREALDDRPKPS